MIDPPSSKVPKDANLVDLFRSHRDAFERLATMAIEDTDTFSSISVETQNKEPLTGGLQSLSPERRGEYKRLLSSIRSDLGYGDRRFHDVGVILVLAWWTRLIYRPQLGERDSLFAPRS
jgi:hypothetical protein